MDKALKEITVGEWKAICDQRAKEIHEEVRWGAACDGCPMSSVCAITPDDWELPEDTPTEGSKPRLAEVLGVEVGERFKMGNFPELVYITEDGNIVSTGSGAICSKWITDAINHPESIIRAPRLTEAELAICKAVGAKWVSMDNVGIHADLWAEEPIRNEKIFVQSPESRGAIASVRSCLFPSVGPGDCICVEEAGEE